MKKDKTKTHGYALTIGILIMIAFFAILYIKWYCCDRNREIENSQLQEMVDYHRAQGRDIRIFE